jgi:surfeit locus 1 family protein
MLQTLRDKRLLWPSLMTLVGLAITLSLGTWQLQRRAWKEGLIARIEQRTKRPAVPLEEALRVWRETRDVEYLRVRLSGRLLHDKEVHLQAIDRRVAGWHVITPLETASATIVLVNRGFVPDAAKERSLRAQGLPQGNVDITGLARMPPAAKPAFVPDNDPARNRWYWLDFAHMFRTMLENTERPYAPFVVDAEIAHVTAPPAGGATRLALPNRHLEYALTWFGLAATLFGVYVAYVRSRWKN